MKEYGQGFLVQKKQKRLPIIPAKVNEKNSRTLLPGHVCSQTGGLFRTGSHGQDPVQFIDNRLQ